MRYKMAPPAILGLQRRVRFSRGPGVAIRPPFSSTCNTLEISLSQLFDALPSRPWTWSDSRRFP